MRVPGRIYASRDLIEIIKDDDSLVQVRNVACLPGIVQYSLAMPDIHSGYGFPIGGVGATDIENAGVISPGGIGYDINCGVRLMRTALSVDEVKPKLDSLARGIYSTVPVGVGGSGSIKLTDKRLRQMLKKGSKFAVEEGFGTTEDLVYTENNGCMPDADPESVSSRAVNRGLEQSGTLGSGNHFIEIQAVEKIYDDKTAWAFGLAKDQVVVMLHSGSRGLGYQVCDDYIHAMRNVPQKYGFSLPDRQLVCAPFKSPEGQQYFSAVCAAANYAFANRQCLMGLVRKVFEKTFGASAGRLGLTLVYDVAHNIAKIETHTVGGKQKKLCVHRKGATRSFPAGHSELPEQYRNYGQPVLVPGDMGTASYVMVGTQTSMNETFGSVCHGAGRSMSRSEAKRRFSADRIFKELQDKGIVILAKGKSTVVEESSQAYKNIDDVTSAVVGAGLAKKVARLRPLAVVKG
jgi:tRNA-splicing ligase RtcB